MPEACQPVAPGAKQPGDTHPPTDPNPGGVAERFPLLQQTANDSNQIHTIT